MRSSPPSCVVEPRRTGACWEAQDLQKWLKLLSGLRVSYNLKATMRMTSDGVISYVGPKGTKGNCRVRVYEPDDVELTQPWCLSLSWRKIWHPGGHLHDSRTSGGFPPPLRKTRVHRSLPARGLRTGLLPALPSVGDPALGPTPTVRSGNRRARKATARPTDGRDAGRATGLAATGVGVRVWCSQKRYVEKAAGWPFFHAIVRAVRIRVTIFYTLFGSVIQSVPLYRAQTWCYSIFMLCIGETQGTN